MNCAWKFSQLFVSVGTMAPGYLILPSGSIPLSGFAFRHHSLHILLNVLVCLSCVFRPYFPELSRRTKGSWIPKILVITNLFNSHHHHRLRLCSLSLSSTWNRGCEPLPSSEGCGPVFLCWMGATYQGGTREVGGPARCVIGRARDDIASWFYSFFFFFMRW